MNELNFYELRRITVCQCELQAIACRLEAMKAENQYCSAKGVEPVFIKSDFEKLGNEIARLINELYNQS